MKLPVYLRVLLGLAVVICAWVFWQDTQTTVPEAPAQAPATAARNDKNAQPLTETQAAPANAQAPFMAGTVNIFPSQTWRPPAPIVVTTPQTIQPPPMPFKISAQWRYHNEQNIVVITGNGVRYTLCNKCNVPGHITPGTKFDKGYRLDKLTDSTVGITYLPLQRATTLYLKKR